MDGILYTDAFLHSFLQHQLQVHPWQHCASLLQVGGSLLFILHYYYRRLSGFAFRKGLNPTQPRESPRATDNSFSSLSLSISISPESAARYGIPMVAAQVCGSPCA